VNELRRNFHAELDDIRAEWLDIATAVADLVPIAVRAVLQTDLVAADRVIGLDDALDVRCDDLEERCYRLIALQQPVASDLRAITATAKLVGEAERSGDLAVNTAKAGRRMFGATLPPEICALIERMGANAERSFRLAIDAYRERDAALGAAIDDIDDDLDHAHAEFLQEIFRCHQRGTVDLAMAVPLALIGRFLERIGDHAVNIGERVQYMVTGRLPEPKLARPVVEGTTD
jgi:phosphate transport system protein